METVHEGIINRLVADVPRLLVTRLLEKKLAAQGLKLRPRKVRDLADQVLSGRSGALVVRKYWPWFARQSTEIRLTEDDLQEITQSLDDFLKKGFPKVLHDVMEDTADRLLEVLKRRWPRHSRRLHKDIRGFRKRLRRRWGKGLEALTMLVAIAREVGAEVNVELRDHGDSGTPHLIEVMTRLHSRACQITEEVICLLEGGFADGAMARWRTLHELAAVSILMIRHGEELVKRYVAHEIVESRKAALQYVKWQERLGEARLEADELARLEEQYDAVLQKYGVEFRNSQGWASKHLDNPNPTIAQLHEAAGIEHLDPYYRMASHNVHANPKGVFFKLGLIGEEDTLRRSSPPCPSPYLGSTGIAKATSPSAASANSPQSL